MPKHVYVYEDLVTGDRVVVTSIMQLSGLSGISYRSAQRKIESGLYCDPYGKFRFWRSNYIQDRRSNNHNPNFK